MKQIISIDGQDHWHETLRTLIMGIVTGIAVTVLYQNTTGMQAGRAAPLTPPTKAETPAPTAIQTAQADAKLPELVQVVPSDAKYPPTPMRLVPMPGLPLLPETAKTTKLVTNELDTPKFELRDIKVAVAQKGKGEEDSEAAGVHVKIRGGESNSTEKENPVAEKTKEEKADTKEGVALSKAKKEGPPSPNKKDSPEKLVEESSATKEDTPQYKIVREQEGGVLIKIGNQVRFISEGSLLPNGEKVSHTQKD